jgi:hypothetical protein
MLGSLSGFRSDKPLPGGRSCAFAILGSAEGTAADFPGRSNGFVLFHLRQFASTSTRGQSGTEASCKIVCGAGFKCEPSPEAEQKRKIVMAITVFTPTGAAQQLVSGSMAELSP